MIKYCECGCGKIVSYDRRFIIGHSSRMWKGKNFEERYTKGQADEIKKKMSQVRKGKNKGRTNVERFGKDRAEEIKLKKSKIMKGKNTGKFEERWSKDRVEEIRLKKSKSRTIWTKNIIINFLISRKEKITTRSSLDKFHHYFPHDICCVETMRKKCGSTDNIAKLLDIEFEKPKFRGGLGSDEQKILDDVEKENGVIIQRQHYVAGKFIDGYDKINNVAYEVDEPHHKHQRIEDKIREDKIKKILGCKFVRITI